MRLHSRRYILLVASGLILSHSQAWAQTTKPQSKVQPQPSPQKQSDSQHVVMKPAGDGIANTVSMPSQILKSGINLTEVNLAPNTKQVANLLNLMPTIERIQTLREQCRDRSEVTLENIALRQELTEQVVKADHILQQANQSIDFVVAEIGAEINVYDEILSTFTAARDKYVARTNQVSFYTNGALWAIGEALDIPTWKRPKYSISSGTVSILAGVVPSIASLWAMHVYSGKHTRSESDPNMLAKLFDYPVNPEIDYPKFVWDYLTEKPAEGGSESKTRREILIDRWVKDSNIASFTDAKSKKQLDVITASAERSRGLSIDTLNTRQVMLNQLSAEILKIKRYLFELSMAVSGEKKV